jgi:hypothetical protein
LAVHLLDKALPEVTDPFISALAGLPGSFNGGGVKTNAWLSWPRPWPQKERMIGEQPVIVWGARNVVLFFTFVVLS